MSDVIYEFVSEPDCEKDLCLECGRQVKSKLYGGDCHDTVHQSPCMKCGRLCGVITDDDQCGPEKMVCPDCMDKARRKER